MIFTRDSFKTDRKVKCEKWGEFYQENVKVQYYSINIKNEINIIKINGNFSLH